MILSVTKTSCHTSAGSAAWRKTVMDGDLTFLTVCRLVVIRPRGLGPYSRAPGRFTGPPPSGLARGSVLSHSPVFMLYG